MMSIQSPLVSARESVSVWLAGDGLFCYSGVISPEVAAGIRGQAARRGVNRSPPRL